MAVGGRLRDCTRRGVRLCVRDGIVRGGLRPDPVVVTVVEFPSVWRGRLCVIQPPGAVVDKVYMCVVSCRGMSRCRNGCT